MIMAILLAYPMHFNEFVSVVATSSLFYTKESKKTSTYSMKKILCAIVLVLFSYAAFAQQNIETRLSSIQDYTQHLQSLLIDVENNYQVIYTQDRSLCNYSEPVW
jgi:hypothetical protein